MSKKKHKMIEELVDDIIVIPTQEFDIGKVKFKVGDTVTNISDIKQKVYVIYSITQYQGGRYTISCWDGEDYYTMEEWQLHKYDKPLRIGFNN